jgi:hypothetical protein
MNRLRPTSIIVVLVALSCGSSTNWQGEWIGERQVQARPGADPMVVLTLKQVKLTIKDSSYELIQEGIPRSGPIRTSGKNATLIAAAVAGREPTQAIPDTELTFNEDGTITLLDPAAPNEPVVLSRRPEK